MCVLDEYYLLRTPAASRTVHSLLKETFSHQHLCQCLLKPLDYTVLLQEKTDANFDIEQNRAI